MIALFPFSSAIDNAVSQFLFILFTSAPCSTKYFTTASFPLEHALNNGVLSSLSVLLIFAPCSTRYFTIFSFPFSHAINKGVPRLFFFIYICSMFN